MMRTDKECKRYYTRTLREYLRSYAREYSTDEEEIDFEPLAQLIIQPTQLIVQPFQSARSDTLSELQGLLHDSASERQFCENRIIQFIQDSKKIRTEKFNPHWNLSQILAWQAYINRSHVYPHIDWSDLEQLDDLRWKAFCYVLARIRSVSSLRLSLKEVNSLGLERWSYFCDVLVHSGPKTFHLRLDSSDLFNIVHWDSLWEAQLKYNARYAPWLYSRLKLEVLDQLDPSHWRFFLDKLVNCCMVELDLSSVDLQLLDDDTCWHHFCNVLTRAPLKALVLPWDVLNLIDHSRLSQLADIKKKNNYLEFIKWTDCDCLFRDMETALEDEHQLQKSLNFFFCSDGPYDQGDDPPPKDPEIRRALSRLNEIVTYGPPARKEEALVRQKMLFFRAFEAHYMASLSYKPTDQEKRKAFVEAFSIYTSAIPKELFHELAPDDQKVFDGLLTGAHDIKGLNEFPLTRSQRQVLLLKVLIQVTKDELDPQASTASHNLIKNINELSRDGNWGARLSVIEALKQKHSRVSHISRTWVQLSDENQFLTNDKYLLLILTEYVFLMKLKRHYHWYCENQDILKRVDEMFLHDQKYYSLQQVLIKLIQRSIDAKNTLDVPYKYVHDKHPIVEEVNLDVVCIENGKPAVVLVGRYGKPIERVVHINAQAVLDKTDANLEELNLKLKCVEHLLPHLKAIDDECVRRRKTEWLSSNADTLEQVNREITSKLEKYIEGTIDLEEFKTRANKVIDCLKPNLHCKGQQLLANLALAIALLGVGYIVAGLIHQCQTGRFLLFDKQPKVACRILDNTRQSIERHVVNNHS